MRSQNKNNFNWQIPEHLLDKLTLNQLSGLGDLNPDTNEDYTFRKVQFRKQFDVKCDNSRKNSRI